MSTPRPAWWALCRATAILLAKNFSKSKEGVWDEADYSENVHKWFSINLPRTASHTLQAYPPKHHPCKTCYFRCTLNETGRVYCGLGLVLAEAASNLQKKYSYLSITCQGQRWLSQQRHTILRDSLEIAAFSKQLLSKCLWRRSSTSETAACFGHWSIPPGW